MIELNLLERPFRANYSNYLPAHEIHIWHFTFNITESINTYWYLLSKDEQDRALKFYFEKDQKTYIFSRGILRLILGQYIGISPKTINLKYSSYGKPFIDPLQNKNQLYFNISHTRQHILYAFTKNTEIGIDIEYLKSDIDYQSVAKNVFSTYEYQTITKAPLEKQCVLFYKIWTSKEAFLKAIGLGLSYPLSDFDVCVAENQTIKIRDIKYSSKEAKQWMLYSLTPCEGYISTVATKQKINRIVIYNILGN